jgi:hypothetical protein
VQVKTEGMNVMTKRKKAKPRKQTPDDQMSPEEKQDFEDQTEEFEGPDRREVRGTEKKRSEDPGVSSS